MSSFAEELVQLYNTKQAEFASNKDINLTRRRDDITIFFEKEIKEGAKEKMLARANVGRPTANIIEYASNERFYIDPETENVVRYTRGEVNFPNYRINDVVVRDGYFKALLKKFEEELSSDQVRITFSCWRPNIMTYVIEAVWGRNRYHKQSSSDDVEMTDNEVVSSPKPRKTRKPPREKVKRFTA